MTRTHYTISVHEHVAEGEIVMVFKGTEEMVADYLTKGLMGNRFRKFRVQLMGHDAEGVL